MNPAAADDRSHPLAVVRWTMISAGSTILRFVDGAVSWMHSMSSCMPGKPHITGRLARHGQERMVIRDDIWIVVAGDGRLASPQQE
ncbi:hypothetical protein ACP26L_19210 [Paenibacillus sp. S-38]|uniref:hypothetical protein n=1 Tax=Paenibacillus sp. S-38 TaxID=3416710 RepID=UPI003CED521F